MAILRSVDAIFHTSSQKYSYYVPEGDDPKVGDFILTSVDFSEGVYSSDTVHTIEMIRNARFARIVAIHDIPSPKALKFYVHLFPVNAFKKKIAENAALAKRYTEQLAARQKLNELLLEDHAMKLYEKLAEDNPEARALLDVLKQ